MQRRFQRLLLPAALMLLSAAAPPMAFSPETPPFAGAARDYQSIWDADGARIVQALERASGLDLADAPIQVIVFEGRSASGLPGVPMRLRASYSNEAKRATLVHELGHRLIAGLPRLPEVDEHRTLFLFLYEAWTELWGRDFADRMVALERERRGYYDYDAAWTWALAMTREQRQAMLARIRALPR